MFAVIATIEDESARELITELYIKYYNTVRAKAFAFVHDDFEAEEIVQEAFVRLIEHSDLLLTLNKASLPVYVMTTVKNTAIKHWNKNKENAENSDFDSEESLLRWADDKFALPEELYVQKEQLSALARAIPQLSEKDRYLLESKYILQLSDKEIAQGLNIGSESVRTCLMRARRRAYAIMKGEMHDE